MKGGAKSLVIVPKIVGRGKHIEHLSKKNQEVSKCQVL
jgi:hypothetical protein